MPRKVNIITTSFHRDSISESAMEHRLRKAIRYLDAFHGCAADLILLPEFFLTSGLPFQEDPSREIEMTEEALESISRRARELNSYVVAGFHEFESGQRHNVSCLFGRNGVMLEKYYKNSPTLDEMNIENVMPGSDACVVDVDFGRLGLLTCYDIGFPAMWQKVAEQGAELVAWIADYDGGFPLQSYAWTHSFYIATSVNTSHAQIIDKTGKILAHTSPWIGWVCHTVDLEKETFHVNFNDEILLQVQKTLGNKIKIEPYLEEGVFTLESNCADWPVERIKREFGLENFDDYHARAYQTKCKKLETRND